MISARPIGSGDRGFVVQTWVRSFAEYSPWASASRTRREHWSVVDDILAGPHVRAVVLCSGGSESTLHGWAVASRDALHYAYVPPELRGHGLARRAISAALGAYPATIAVTHPWPRPSPRFRWDPYPLFAALRSSGHEPFRAAA